jgi:hypothetical protein
VHLLIDGSKMCIRAVQGIPTMYESWTLKYHDHNSPPMDVVNSVYTFPPHTPETHFKIIPTSTPRSHKIYLPFRFPDHNFLCYCSSIWCVLHMLLREQLFDSLCILLSWKLSIDGIKWMLPLWKRTNTT